MDLFQQQGITFDSAPMASTHPTATPDAITMPKIDIEAAPANQTIPQVDASQLQPPVAGQPRQRNGGAVAPPPDPQQISQSLAGAGNGGSAAPGAAPPQAPANSDAPVDLFAQEKIQAPSFSTANTNAFNSGVTLSQPKEPTTQADTTNAPLMQDTDSAQGTQAVQQYVAHEQDKLQQLAQTRFTPEQLEGMKNNPITFTDAFKKLSPVEYALGSGADALKLLPIALKVQQGQQLDQTEQKTMNDYVDKQIELSMRGFTWGGKIAYIGAQIPSWAAQFMISGGVGKVAESIAQKAGIVAAEKTIQSAAIRLATQYASIMPAQYIAKYAEQQLNDISAITDKGQMILKQAEESPGQAALMAFGHANADVVSQMAAPLVGKYLVAPVGRVLSTPITVAASKLSPQVNDALYRAWKAVQPNTTVSKMFSQIGWSGMVEQLGANRVNQILNSSVDYAGSKDMTFDDYVNHLKSDIAPSKDQLFVEGGLLAIAGGIHASTSIAFNMMRARGVPAPEAQNAVDNMSALEKDQFVNNNLPTPKSDTPALQEQTPQQTRMSQTIPATSDVLHNDEVLHQNSTARLVAGQANAASAANPPQVAANQSFFNKAWSHWKDTVWPSLYAETINDVQPIENLSKKAEAAGVQIPEGQQSAMLTSFTKATPEWIRRNWTTDTTTWDNDGNQVVTGKGLKSIYDDFDNMAIKGESDMKARHGDLNDYLIARTLTEDMQKGISEVTPKQQADSAAMMARLASKYGNDFAWFSTFADELRDWDNRILHNLVTSGIKTQAWYDDTISQRQHYSPLNRVVQEEFEPSISAGGLGKDVSPSGVGSLQRRKGGSDLEVKDTFQSRLKNSAMIMQRSALNKLRADIAKFASYYPDEVKIKRPAVLASEVKHSYDPVLRTKLEQLVEFLGGEVKRMQQGDKVPSQLRGALGSYEPATENIFLKPGTTEGTLTHEAGHMLDYMLDLKKRLLGDKTITAELEKLAEDRLRREVTLQTTPDGKTEFAEKFERHPAKYVGYVKNPDEILANFFDAWVNSPEQVERTAPTAKAAFEKLIDENPQLAVLKQIEPSTQRAQETLQRAVLDMRGQKGTIPVYLNGARNFLDLSPALQKAFQNMSPIEMGMAEKFLGGIARTAKRTLQFGATATPDFMLRHFYRAIFSSFLNAKDTSVVDFVKHATIDMPKAIFAVIGKNELYREWASSSGALNTFLDLSDKNVAKLQKQMFSEGNMASFLNPVKWFKVAKEVSDYAPRIAVFEKAKEQGKSDLAAGLLSLEATGNYIRHGSLVKRINQYAPFFNDMVQGGDRFIRSQLRDPVGFTMRALATIAVPQMILTGYYLFAADDKTRQEYLNLPEWRRGISMNIKIGDTWVPFPRPFAPGYVYGAVPEKLMIWMYGGQHAPLLKNYWLNQLAELATSVSPVFDWSRAINPILKSAIENITNYSFFRQGPIFRGDLEKTAPQNQFNDQTSETSKLMGKMFNYSPAKLDNTVYNMSGNAGKYAMQFSDWAINQERKAAGQAVNQKPERATDNPLYGGLIEQTPRGLSGEDYREFREHLTDSEQASNIFKETRGAEKAQYQHDNARALAAYPPINAVNTQINHIQHQIRLINQNTNLSGYDKQAQITRLQDQETALIEGANQRYRLATGEAR